MLLTPSASTRHWRAEPRPPQTCFANVARFALETEANMTVRRSISANSPTRIVCTKRPTSALRGKADLLGHSLAFSKAALRGGSPRCPSTSVGWKLASMRPIIVRLCFRVRRFTLLGSQQSPSGD